MRQLHIFMLFAIYFSGRVSSSSVLTCSLLWFWYIHLANRNFREHFVVHCEKVGNDIGGRPVSTVFRVTHSRVEPDVVVDHGEIGIHRIIILTMLRSKTALPLTSRADQFIEGYAQFAGDYSCSAV